DVRIHLAGDAAFKATFGRVLTVAGAIIMEQWEAAVPGAPVVKNSFVVEPTVDLVMVDSAERAPPANAIATAADGAAAAADAAIAFSSYRLRPGVGTAALRRAVRSLSIPVVDKEWAVAAILRGSLPPGFTLLSRKGTPQGQGRSPGGARAGCTVTTPVSRTPTVAAAAEGTPGGPPAAAAAGQRTPPTAQKTGGTEPPAEPRGKGGEGRQLQQDQPLQPLQQQKDHQQKGAVSRRAGDPDGQGDCVQLKQVSKSLAEAAVEASAAAAGRVAEAAPSVSPHIQRNGGTRKADKGGSGVAGGALVACSPAPATATAVAVAVAETDGRHAMAAVVTPLAEKMDPVRRLRDSKQGDANPNPTAASSLPPPLSPTPQARQQQQQLQQQLQPCYSFMHWLEAAATNGLAVASSGFHQYQGFVRRHVHRGAGGLAPPVEGLEEITLGNVIEVAPLPGQAAPPVMVLEELWEEAGAGVGAAVGGGGACGGTTSCGGGVQRLASGRRLLRSEETPFHMAPAPLPHLYRTSFRNERVPLEALGRRLRVYNSAAAAAAAATGMAAASADITHADGSGAAATAPPQFVCQFSYEHRTMSLGMVAPSEQLQPWKDST
ncbi:hypothetical protein Vretifemale_12632, partial [Volvox reticuliferus]